MRNTVNNNSLPALLIIVVFVIAGGFYKTKINNPTNEVSQETFNKAPEATTIQTTRDCRTWKPIKYSTVKSDDGDDMEIKNDAENHEHRLDSWNKKWKSYPDSYESRSGVGSTLRSSENFREGLEKLVDFLKSELKKDRISILDSSCGDMNWMPTFLQGRADIDYTGYDLLPVNIDTARQRFKNETWKFETFDLVKDRIKNQFDLLINRHTAIHLGLHDNIQMFHNFYQSSSKYLLTTTYPLQTRNTQLFLSGKPGFHEINLALPPFQLPVPICQAPDDPNSGNGGQFFALWVMNSLDSFDARNVDLIRPYKP